MCGRFEIHETLEKLKLIFNLSGRAVFDVRYNIAPQQDVPVVLTSRKSGNRELHHLRWGLVPVWAKDPTIGHKLINARSETIMEKPSFKDSFRDRRCIIPASGFFEWQPGSHQPYYISDRTQAPLAFAGIWDRWQGPAGSVIASCSIITRPASPAITELHHRMPVMLAEDQFSNWLNPESTPDQAFAAMERPIGDDRIQSWAVSDRVNSPMNDDPSLLERVEPYKPLI